MAINQKQVLSLQQKLSPQQIQMIKLLELPTVQLEQRIKQEIEDNIVLEEEDRAAEDEEQPQQISVDEYLREDDTPSYKSRINNYSKDDKQRPVFLTEGRSLQEYLIEQLGFRNLSEREMKLAVYLVGSIDEDGYLRRDLESVADDIAFTVGIETRPRSWRNCSASSMNWNPPASAPAISRSACCCKWRRYPSIRGPAGWRARY